MGAKLTPGFFIMPIYMSCSPSNWDTSQCVPSAALLASERPPAGFFDHGQETDQDCSVISVDNCGSSQCQVLGPCATARWETICAYLILFGLEVLGYFLTGFILKSRATTLSNMIYEQAYRVGQEPTSMINELIIKPLSNTTSMWREYAPWMCFGFALAIVFAFA